MDLDKLKEIHGEVVELLTPSGNRVLIRQQNGNDDDIISNGLSAFDGTAIPKFLSGIILEWGEKRLPLSPSEVLLLRLPDIYYIMIASRIFSLGQILEFQYKWDDIEQPVEYTEDLGLYIWDYSKEFPISPEDPNYFEFRIKPISNELTRSLTLTSGKKLTYTYMNGNGEKYLMKLPQNQQSKNQEIIARNLKQETASGYIVVENFKFFSPQDMRELRSDIFKNDPTLEIFSEIKHPTNKLKTIFYPIMASNDFFFLREIL